MANTVDIHEDYVARIVHIIEQATIEERAAGMVWYGAYGKAIRAYGESHGYTGEQSTALFAALSPRARIDRNWRNFKIACEDGTPVRCLCLTGPHRAKVARYLAGLSTQPEVCSGDKVTAFYANLTGNLDPVTIDRHAAAVCLGQSQARRGVSHKQYGDYALAYQAAAKLLDIEPAQAQAIAWIVWRRLKGIHDGGGLNLIA